MWQPYFLLSTVAATLPRSQPDWKCMKGIILFVCVRNACSGFSSDHQGPVSNVGPLGSQRSHHATPRGNKVCARPREGAGGGGVSVLYVAVHMRLHLFPCSQHVCVLLRHLWKRRSGNTSFGRPAEASAARPVCSKATEAPDSPLVTVYLSTNTGRSV